MLDQDKCRYTPRVLGVRVGQALQIRNSDPLLHNVRSNGVINQAFNKSTPIEGDELQPHVRDEGSHGAVQVRRARLDERLGRRARSSVLRHDRAGWPGRARQPAAGHLHHRSVARIARHAGRSRSPSAPKNRRMSASPSHADARAGPSRPREDAFARRRFRLADEAASEFPRPADDGGGVFARRRSRRHASSIWRTRCSARSSSPAARPRSTRCGSGPPIG